MSNEDGKENRILFHQSSVRALADSSLLTAPVGRGIWKSATGQGWESYMAGMPKELHVNRLSGLDDRLFACTDKGLYTLKGDHWFDMNLSVLCYEYKESGGAGFAATEYGLWSKTSSGWKNTSFSQNAVYDFLMTPHFLFLAWNGGITMYDRYTCTWEPFPLKVAVMRLAYYQGALLGITERGELLQGNKRGGFELFRFPGMFIFNAVQHNRNLYLCTDRGLYRVTTLHNQLSLISVSLGCPVTDLDGRGKSLHMATLNEGIQTIQL